MKANMAVVYVFGAGASREVGYPLASNMGAMLLDVMQNSEDLLTNQSGRFFAETFGMASDIEELITEVQSRIKRLEGGQSLDERTQRTNLGTALGFLGNAIQQWFRTIRTNPAPSYAAFAEFCCVAGDVVITFNYDDSLERELRRLEKWDAAQGYGFPLSPIDRPSDVYVLKLHGSINWLVSLFGGATSGTFAVGRTTMGEHPVVHRTDLTFLGYESFSGQVYSGGGAFPCLILPGRTKEFFYDTSLGREYGDFWNTLWSQAGEALRACDKLILAGYSLLPVDQRARDLLLKSPPKDIPVEVISGSQTERIASDFRLAGFNDVREFKGGYFSDWVKAQHA